MRRGASLRVTRRACVRGVSCPQPLRRKTNAFNLSLPHFRLISLLILVVLVVLIAPYVSILLCLAPNGQRRLTPDPAYPRRCHRLQRIPRAYYSAVCINLLSIHFCRISTPFTFPSTNNGVQVLPLAVNHHQPPWKSSCTSYCLFDC